MIKYHRVKINVDLLKKEVIFSNYLKGIAKSTLPMGKVVGVRYNAYKYNDNYLFDLPVPGLSVVEGDISPIGTTVNDTSFAFSQTDISILDSQNIPLTERVSLEDYKHLGGGYLEGFKKIKIESSKDHTVIIQFDTLGTLPICGEFIFAIEQEDCGC